MMWWPNCFCDLCVELIYFAVFQLPFRVGFWISLFHYHVSWITTYWFVAPWFCYILSYISFYFLVQNCFTCCKVSVVSVASNVLMYFSFCWENCFTVLFCMRILSFTKPFCGFWIILLVFAVLIPHFSFRLPGVISPCLQRILILGHSCTWVA